MSARTLDLGQERCMYNNSPICNIITQPISYEFTVFQNTVTIYCCVCDASVCVSVWLHASCVVSKTHELLSYLYFSYFNLNKWAIACINLCALQRTSLT